MGGSPGIALMVDKPRRLAGVVDVSNLVRMNQQALTACVEASAKANEDQCCAITAAPKRILS